MADFTPIAFGSNGWDKKINEALIQIFAGGVTDSGWVPCATLVNGAQDYATAVGATYDTSVSRRVLDFHKFKIVLISGAITTNTTSFQETLITLPSGFPNTGAYPMGMINTAGASGNAKWELSKDGTRIACNASTVQNEGANPWYPINLMYIS